MSNKVHGPLVFCYREQHQLWDDILLKYLTDFLNIFCFLFSVSGSCCANGKKYNVGDFILKRSNNLEICQRQVCIFGRLIKLGDYPCPEKTENNRKNIIDKHPAEFGQFYVRRRSVPTTIPPYFTTTIPTTKWLSVPILQRGARGRDPKLLNTANNPRISGKNTLWHIPQQNLKPNPWR